MKGYRMVLLVNGALLLFVSLSSLLLATTLDHDAQRCRSDPTEPPAKCEQTGRVATATFRVSPVLFVIGLVLLVLGILLGRGPERAQEAP